MEETVKHRLLLFIREKGLSQKRFEETAHLSNGYVNNLKASPSSAIIQKILYAFPDLSQSWLLTGEGPMLAPTTDDSSLAGSVVNGPHSSQAVGNGARAVNGEGVKECLEIMRRQQESIAKLVETVNRLTKIISER